MNIRTLRGKFVVAFWIVGMVSVILFLGIRWLEKAALFHYLERQHHHEMLTIDKIAAIAAEGGPGAAALRRDQLVASVIRGEALASRADTELTGIEKVMFRVVGFGGLLDLPRENIQVMESMKRKLQAEAGSAVTPLLVQAIRPELNKSLEEETTFIELLRRAVGFIEIAVFAMYILCVAALVATLLMLKRSTLRPLEEAVAAAGRVASGDLTGSIVVEGEDEVAALMGVLRTMNQNLARMVAELRGAAEEINVGASEIASGSVDLSQRTEEQASSLEETAATMEQMTATVRQNAANAGDAESLAREAAAVAGRGGEAVDRVVRTMSELEGSSGRISDISSVIDGIAFQTNILALNAAVEAARAGEQGRGFAVVASEVRTLAQRSASAAKEIKALIADSVGRVRDGAKHTEEAGRMMQEIVAAVGRVSTLVGGIASASREQSAGIEQVNQAVVQMEQVTQKNAALVEEASAAAEALRQQAERLVSSARVFKLSTAGKSPASEVLRAARATPPLASHRQLLVLGHPLPSS